MKLIRYRIVTDNHSGYEVQKWRLWLPFWIELSDNRYYGYFSINTNDSIEKAEKLISDDINGQNGQIRFKSKIIKYYEHN